MVLSETVFHLFIQSQLSVKEIEESLELGLSPADLILHSTNLDLAVQNGGTSDHLQAMAGENSGSSNSLVSLATDSSGSND